MVSSVEVYESALRVVEKYGVAVILSVALMWILRSDVLIPLVEEHRLFVRELSATQKEISRAISEQALILSRLERSNQPSDAP